MNDKILSIVALISIAVLIFWNMQLSTQISDIGAKISSSADINHTHIESLVDGLYPKYADIEHTHNDFNHTHDDFNHDHDDYSSKYHSHDYATEYHFH